MVALLVEHRADVNATRLNGCTPLMDACRAGEAAVVRTLCESGANTNILDKPGGLRAERYAEQGAGQQSQATEDPNQRWRWALGNEEEQRVWGWSANPTGVDKAHRSVDDFVACSRALGEWGSRGGYITREDFFGAIVNEVDVPSEYVVAFH